MVIRTLLVDDDESRATALTRLLIQADCEVGACISTAEDREEAVHAFQPELIIFETQKPCLLKRGYSRDTTTRREGAPFGTNLLLKNKRRKTSSSRPKSHAKSSSRPGFGETRRSKPRA